MSQMSNDPREAVYDEQIDPLMKRIIELCKTHHIPFVAAFQCSATDDEDGTVMVASGLWDPGDDRRIARAIDVVSPEKFFGVQTIGLLIRTEKES